MRVLDHAPRAWFLLEEGDALYLDVNCSHSAVGFSVLIELDEQERRRLEEEGRAYLDDLSRAIQYSAPIVRESRSSYTTRDVTSVLGGQVMEAVLAWQSSAPPAD